MYALYLYSRPAQSRPDDYDDWGDDWGGGSDRNQPIGPWWPPGVSTEPMRERELV